MNILSSLLNYIGNQILALRNRFDLIQGGTIPTTTVPARSYVDVKITFPKKYTNPPATMAAITSGSTSADIGMFTVTAMNITNTGFTARFFNASSTDRQPGGRWIAIP